MSAIGRGVCAAPASMPLPSGPPFYGDRQLGSLGSHRKGAGGQRIGFRSMTAAAEFPVTFGWYPYRLEARLLGWWGSSSAQRDGGRVRAPAPTADTESCSFCLKGRTLAGPPMTKDFRYTAGGAIPYPLWPFGPSPIDKGSRPLPYGFRENLPFLRRGAQPLGAPAVNRPSTVSSANPGAVVKPHQRQFLQT